MVARPILKSTYSARDFNGMFGTSPEVCALTWNMLDLEQAMPGVLPKHLLWALMLMKTYAKEKTLCIIAGGVTRTTFRKWAWLIIPRIAGLKSTVVRTNLFSTVRNCCPGTHAFLLLLSGDCRSV